MPTVIKFNEKNKVLFGKTESVAGDYETTIAATDALAATAITGSATYETASYQYLGDVTSRDEFTYLKDNFADISVETPQQVLGVLNPALPINDFPLTRYYQACGATVTIDGSGFITATNTTVSPNKLSFNFSKTSSDDAVNEKNYKFYASWGTLDLSADVGDLPKLKFNFKGNVYAPVITPIVTPDFGNQTTRVANTIRLATIVEAKITPYGETFNDQSSAGTATSVTRVGTLATVTLTAHGLVDGQKVAVRGATGADADYYNGDFIISYVDANTFTYVMNGTPAASPATGTITVYIDGWYKSFCFNTLQAPNAFGFELQRYLTGCEEGFDRKAVPTDVNFTMLESHSARYEVTTLTRTGTTATLTTNTPHGLTTGDSITVVGADDPLYNITTLCTVTGASTLTYVMGGTPGADAAALTNEGMNLIDNEATYFDPDANLLEFFQLKLKFGTEAAKYISYEWNKVQLANVKDGKVATSEGRDVTLRNTGNFTIIHS